MTKDEALKLALEALVLNNAEWKHLADSGDSGDWSAEDQDHYKQTEEAITAIKEALAQPEQDWRALVLNHNADCDARCDMDRCGYKPYYEYNGRRCPDCPVYDKIEAAHGIKGEA